jgi:uncharacterized protein
VGNTTLKKRCVLWLAAFSIFVTIGFIVPASAVEQTITLGTATSSGVYYPTGGAICRLVNRGKATHGLLCNPQTSSGSVANINALRKGRVQFAVVQSNVQYEAYHGVGLFAGKPLRQLRALFSLYSEPLAVVVRADSGYTQFHDLRGARVNIGPAFSAQRATLLELFQAMGWSLANFPKLTEYGWNAQIKALCSGQIDAAFYAVGQPSAVVREATEACNTRLLPIAGADAKRIQSHAPYFGRDTIPAGMYPSIPVATATVGVRATVVTTSQTDKQLVLPLVQSVMDNVSDFRTLHPVFAALDVTHMVQDGNTAPLHDTARRYYETKGLLKPAR